MRVVLTMQSGVQVPIDVVDDTFELITGTISGSLMALKTQAIREPGMNALMWVDPEQIVCIHEEIRNEPEGEKAEGVTCSAMYPTNDSSQRVYCENPFVNHDTHYSEEIGKVWR